MAQVVASRNGWSERGAALVELALVLPLLLVLIAGIVDFGFAFQRYEVVANAAREGARLGTKKGFSTAAIQQRVRDYIQQGLNIQSTAALDAVVPVGNITVTSPDLTAPISGGTVTITTSRVEVAYQHQFLLMRPILGLINKTWGSGITMRATSVMAVEGA